MKKIAIMTIALIVLACVAYAGTKEDYDAAKATVVADPSVANTLAFNNAWYAHAKFVAPKVGNSNLSEDYRDYCFRFAKKYIDTSGQADARTAEVDALLYTATVALLNDPALGFINTAKTKQASRWAVHYNYVKSEQLNHPADAAVFQGNQIRRAKQARAEAEVLFITNFPSVVFVNPSVVSSLDAMKASIASGNIGQAATAFAEFRTNFPVEYREINKQIRKMNRENRIK